MPAAYEYVHSTLWYNLPTVVVELTDLHSSAIIKLMLVAYELYSRQLCFSLG